MWDQVLSRLGSDELFALLALTLTGATVVAALFAVQWRKIRQAEVDASLKREMLARGMSAEEILQVLGASTAKRCRSEQPRPADDLRAAADNLHVRARQFADEIRADVKQALNRAATRL